MEEDLNIRICTYKTMTLYVDYWFIRSKPVPAVKYLSYINGDEEELTEDLQGLDINGDEPAENGHGFQEVQATLISDPSCL